MALKERQRVQGILNIQVRDESHNIIETRRVKNIVTKQGKELLAKTLAVKSGITSLEQLKIFVGNNGTQQTVDDEYATTKEPGIDLGEDRFWKTVDVTTSVEVGDDIKTVFKGVLDADTENLQSEFHIKEAGIIFITSSEGGDADAKLFNRTTFPVINKKGKMVITFTWEIIF